MQELIGFGFTCDVPTAAATTGSKGVGELGCATALTNERKTSNATGVIESFRGNLGTSKDAFATGNAGTFISSSSG